MNIFMNIEKESRSSFILSATILSFQGEHPNCEYFRIFLFTQVSLFFFFSTTFQFKERFFIICPSCFVFISNRITLLFYLIFLLHVLIEASFEVFLMTFKFSFRRVLCFFNCSKAD